MAEPIVQVAAVNLVMPRDTSTAPVSESRTGRAAWSVGLALVSQFVNLAVGLWLTRFLVERLGDAVLGWWAQALVFAGYLGLIDFGVSSLLPREVAASVGRAGGKWQSAVDLPAIIARFQKFAIWQLPVAAMVAVSFGAVLTQGSPPDTPTVVLLGVTTALFPLRTGSAVLVGLQDVRVIGAAQSIVYLAGVGVTVASVIYGLGAGGLVLGWATQTFLITGVAWFRLWSRYRGVIHTIPTILAAPLTWRMFADGGWAWLASVGVTMAGTAELIVIGWLCPREDVFRYACTVKLVMVSSPLVLILCPAVLPGLTEIRAGMDRARVGRVVLAYTQLILGLSGLIGCIILATNSGFVSWWVGSERDVGEVTIVAAVAGMNMRHWLNAVAVTLFAVNRERSLWIITFVDGIISLGLTAIWVNLEGAAMAPFGPLTAVTLFTLPALLWVMNAEGVVCVRRLLRSTGGWAIPYLGIGTTAFAIGRTIRPEDRAILFAVGVAAASVYTALTILLFSRYEIWDYVRPRLGRLIRG